MLCINKQSVLDTAKYNEIKKALNTNDFSKRKMSKNVTDIFDYIFNNKATLDDLAEKNCFYAILKMS